MLMTGIDMTGTYDNLRVKKVETRMLGWNSGKRLAKHPVTG